MERQRRGQTRQSYVPTAAERAGDFTNTSCSGPQPTGLVAAGLANPNTPYILNSISPGFRGSDRFIAIGCVPKVRLSPLSQRN